jgi:hypothetical protein
MLFVLCEEFEDTKGGNLGLWMDLFYIMKTILFVLFCIQLCNVFIHFISRKNYIIKKHSIGWLFWILNFESRTSYIESPMILLGVCIRNIELASVSLIFLRFGNCSDGMACCVFHCTSVSSYLDLFHEMTFSYNVNFCRVLF